MEERDLLAFKLDRMAFKKPDLLLVLRVNHSNTLVSEAWDEVVEKTSNIFKSSQVEKSSCFQFDGFVPLWRELEGSVKETQG